MTITSGDLAELRRGHQFGVSSPGGSTIHLWCRVSEIKGNEVTAEVINGGWDFSFDRKNPHVATMYAPNGPEEIVLEIAWYNPARPWLDFSYDQYNEAVKHLNTLNLQ